uniref:Ribosome biogenesis protein BOP1 homolog n=1 Tax=Glossina morsitans morsitans TaxID=37546 RepID=A0A1B0G4D6_GLOMM
MVKGLRKRKSEGVENELSNELNSEVEKNGNVTGDEEEDFLQTLDDDAIGDSSDADEGIDQTFHSGDSDSGNSGSSELEFESGDEQLSDNENIIKDYAKNTNNDTDEDSINEAEIEDISTSDEDGVEDSEDKKQEAIISKKLQKTKKSAKKNNQKLEDVQPSTSALCRSKVSVLQEFGKELKTSPKSKEGKNFLKKFQIDKKYENSDTSDEEDIRNTVGNIPMHWYDEYKHLGYDWDAKKIIKPPKGDQIDDFLRKIEDPNFWRTVKDPQTGQEVVLTDADIELIKRINSSRIPNPDHDEYEPWIDWFTREVEKMPIKNVPDHKRSFLPSVSEKKKVGRMVHALKMGWMKTTEELEKERKAKRGPKFYMLWETDTGREAMRRVHDPVSAPKRDLPGHAESYNPPPEYLFDEREEREWLKLKEEPHKRKLHFMPQKYKSLREVPAYPRYLRERFLRCLDLYLCPRARRVKLNIDAEYLIPKLPSPKDLQPFPTVQSMIYEGHKDLVRRISVEPKGEYMVSGSDDKTVKIWEIATGRCIRTIETEDVVRSVAWCPNPKLSIIAVASGNRLLLINPKVGDKMLIKKTDELLSEAPQLDEMENERIKTAVQWSTADAKEQEKGVRLILVHFKVIRQVTWHGRGDYFATVMPEGANRSALIHQLSKRRSQIPFNKSKGFIQCVLFHPIKPCFFVATQHNIRIYDLVKQELIKKLLTNSKWISGMCIHPKGDNLLVSTFDKKMLWFDLDLSTKPYQTMRLHKGAVRNVAFHLRYPLFASASDDQSVIVSHGMVYNDLLQNPLIVPLKKLQTHEKRDVFGVLDVVWHPVQPWVFSSGADCTVRLYT